MMAMAASLARETTSKIAIRVKNLLSQKEQQQQEQARSYWGRREFRATRRANHDGRKIAARVGRMTNWQNHQWMKNGSRDDRIDYYLKLKRPNWVWMGFDLASGEDMMLIPYVAPKLKLKLKLL